MIVKINNCCDFTFNNAPFGVAIQARARHIMNQFFNQCDNLDITLYYGCVDSFLIERSDYAKLQRNGYFADHLKRFHIETETNEAIIKNKGCIYLNNSFYRWSGKNLKNCENVRKMYLIMIIYSFLVVLLSGLVFRVSFSYFSSYEAIGQLFEFPDFGILYFTRYHVT
jgi:hypothetical protein